MWMLPKTLEWEEINFDAINLAEMLTPFSKDLDVVAKIVSPIREFLMAVTNWRRSWVRVHHQ